MEYTNLGRSGLAVSRLCLGTMNFGPHTSEPDSHAILDAALDLGINMVDTANQYGQRLGEGVTESIIGRWFAKGDGRRDKVVLATKVYDRMGDWPNEGKLSARHIRLACDASLRRLQTDYLDLYQMHHIDRATPWDEIWEAFDTLRRQGKIVYTGSSNFAGWHLVSAQESASRHGLNGLVSEQSIYNLLTRQIELEVLPAARSYGIGIIAWSPLRGGMLAGVLAKQADSGRRNSRAAEIERHRPALQAYEDLCRDLGAKPADVGLAWLLAQQGLTAAIIGPRTLEQLRTSAQALDLKLDSAALEALDLIFPGHQPAPEDYAW